MTNTDIAAMLEDPSPALGFVSLSFGSGALTAGEVCDWAWRVIELTEQADIVRLPHCVLHLTEFSGSTPNAVTRVCDPYGGSGLSETEWYAVDGISWRRGLMTKWTIAGRAAAERALKANPHIEVRFRTMFPFVRW